MNMKGFFKKIVKIRTIYTCFDIIKKDGYEKGDMTG